MKTPPDVPREAASSLDRQTGSKYPAQTTSLVPLILLANKTLLKQLT